MQTYYCPVACCGMRMQASSITVKSTIYVHAILTLACLCRALRLTRPSHRLPRQTRLCSYLTSPPKAPRTRRASSQPAQRRTPKPLDFVSTSASQPEVFKHMVGVHLCAVPDSLIRGLPLAQAPRVYNVNGAPRQPSKYPRKNKVCCPSLAIFQFF